MANLTGFDANSVNPATDFEPLPAGKYLAIITDSEMKPTKSGSGNYLELTFQVIDGPFKGRMLWSRLNLDNPNAQAVQIAQGELSAICRAVIFGPEGMRISSLRPVPPTLTLVPPTSITNTLSACRAIAPRPSCLKRYPLATRFPRSRLPSSRRWTAGE